MTLPAELLLRVLAAFLCVACALRARELRPHALVAVAYAMLFALRLVGHPRLDVAVYVLWPAPAVWLVMMGRSAHGRQERRQALPDPSIDVGTGPIERPVDRDGLGGSLGPRNEDLRGRVGRLDDVHAGDAVAAHRPLLPHAALVALPLLLYAALLARYGGYLRAVWPWPILAPNLLPALAVALVGRLPRTWPEVAACVLPASCVADAVTTWAGAPDVVRQVLSAVTWATFCAILLGCSRRG